jgi:uncharacterized membrane protein YdbT with pleckstrin-like domain
MLLEVSVSYIERNLSSGENVLYQTRLHWVVMIAPFCGAVLAAAVGIGLLIRAVSTSNDTSGDAGTLAAGGGLLLVVAAVIVAVAFWRRSKTEMAVTNRRVLVKVGLVSHASIEIMLAKIESIRVEQSVTGRIFGFGTIVVRGTGGTPETFSTIAHPLEFRRQVQEQIDKLPESRSVTQRISDN